MLLIGGRFQWIVNRYLLIGYVNNGGHLVGMFEICITDAELFVTVFESKSCIVVFMC